MKKVLLSLLFGLFCVSSTAQAMIIIPPAPTFTPLTDHSLVAESGKFYSDLGGSLSNFTLPSLNNSGKAAFSGFLSDGNLIKATDAVIVTGQGESSLDVFLNEVTAGLIISSQTPRINNKDEIAFRGRNSSAVPAIFRSNGTTTTTIAEDTDFIPQGASINSGQFFSKRSLGPDLNDQGDVAFNATFSPVIDNQDLGLFVGNGTETGFGDYSRVLQPGLLDASIFPGDRGLLGSSGLYDINNSGQVVLAARTDPLVPLSGGGFERGSAILVGTGGETSLNDYRVVAANYLVDSSSPFSFVRGPVAINDHGDVVFIATNRGASIPGLYKTDKNGNRELVAFLDIFPTSEFSALSTFYNVSINNAGDIVVYAGSIIDSQKRTIFLIDADGNHFIVAEPGQNILGTNTFSVDYSSYGFNDLGQVAFRRSAPTGVQIIVTGAIRSLPDDNNSPVGPATVPEPATAALIGLGLAGAALSRRRKK